MYVEDLFLFGLIKPTETIGLFKQAFRENQNPMNIKKTSYPKKKTFWKNASCRINLMSNTHYDVVSLSLFLFNSPLSIYRLISCVTLRHFISLSAVYCHVCRHMSLIPTGQFTDGDTRNRQGNHYGQIHKYRLLCFF